MFLLSLHLWWSLLVTDSDKRWCCSREQRQMCVVYFPVCRGWGCCHWCCSTGGLRWGKRKSEELPSQILGSSNILRNINRRAQSVPLSGTLGKKGWGQTYRPEVIILLRVFRMVFLVLPEHSWSHISRTSILGGWEWMITFLEGKYGFKVQCWRSRDGLIIKALKNDCGPLR